jgi:hypothetical protein
VDTEALEGKRMKGLLIALVLIGAGFGAYKLLAPPEKAPDLTFEGAAGERIGWRELRDGKRHLLAVFLLPGCSLSDYSAELVSDLHEDYADSVAFVGLAFGTAPFADRYKRDHGLDFDVVGLRTVTDPYAGQEFFDNVRKAYGGSSGIYGGTIILLDEQNQMLFGLAQKDVRELPDRLAAL